MWLPRSARCSRRPKPPRRSDPRWGARIFGRRLMRVSGRSMAPTLHPGELVVVNERAYARRAPRRSELVAAAPSALGGAAVVKRLAGLPHERLDVEGRRWELGEDEFFLLGDGAGHSTDSRAFGPVRRAELLGPAQLRLWPWRVLTNPSQ
ncbi:MAG: S26 family signal peptidase [Candidatus Omnitrophota bacterium]|nr:S26 family signal peptidase [Candidatus Omnitrophota bacterium]